MLPAGVPLTCSSSRHQWRLGGREQQQQQAATWASTAGPGALSEGAWQAVRAAGVQRPAWGELRGRRIKPELGQQHLIVVRVSRDVLWCSGPEADSSISTTSRCSDSAIENHSLPGSLAFGFPGMPPLWHQSQGCCSSVNNKKVSRALSAYELDWAFSVPGTTRAEATAKWPECVAFLAAFFQHVIIPTPTPCMICRTAWTRWCLPCWLSAMDDRTAWILIELEAMFGVRLLAPGMVPGRYVSKRVTDSAL